MTEIAPAPITLRPERTEPVALGEVAAAAGAEVAPDAADVQVTGVTFASGQVRPGDLYVGIRGANAHGAQFAGQAAEAGAVALLTDAEGAALAEASALPVLVVPAPREVLGAVAARLYDYTEGSPQLLGVTGTNGKTSTVHLLEGMIGALGEVAGLSSTAERRVAGEVVVAGLTTPESSDMHSLIATMRERGVATAAIEVSAQALTRHRIDGVRFQVAAFTNLSHDHLDDYASMEEYFDQKVALFQPDRAETGVVSLDTPWGARVVERSGIPVQTITSRDDVEADWRVRTTAVSREGTRFALESPDGERLEAMIPAIGEHHAANAGLAIVMLIAGGRSFDVVRDALAHDGAIPPIPGRTENVAAPGSPAIYVDFGHSADAFAKTLDAVRAVTTGKVIMVFGADGDRDTTKRHDMAAEAVRRSDILVVTDHHPRFEDAASIRRTLAEGALAARPDAELHVVSPPPRAIRLAVSLCSAEDSILWAGPGHQNYREIRGVKTAYSAREQARQALREQGWQAR